MNIVILYAIGYYRHPVICTTPAQLTNVTPSLYVAHDIATTACRIRVLTSESMFVGFAQYTHTTDAAQIYTAGTWHTLTTDWEISVNRVGPFYELRWNVPCTPITIITSRNSEFCNASNTWYPMIDTATNIAQTEPYDPFTMGPTDVAIVDTRNVPISYCVRATAEIVPTVILVYKCVAHPDLQIQLVGNTAMINSIGSIYPRHTQYTPTVEWRSKITSNTTSNIGRAPAAVEGNALGTWIAQADSTNLNSARLVWNDTLILIPWSNPNVSHGWHPTHPVNATLSSVNTAVWVNASQYTMSVDSHIVSETSILHPSMVAAPVRFTMYNTTMIASCNATTTLLDSVYIHGTTCETLSSVWNVALVVSTPSAVYVRTPAATVSFIYEFNIDSAVWWTSTTTTLIAISCHRNQLETWHVTNQSVDRITLAKAHECAVQTAFPFVVATIDTVSFVIDPRLLWHDGVISRMAWHYSQHGRLTIKTPAISHTANGSVWIGGIEYNPNLDNLDWVQQHQAVLPITPDAGMFASDNPNSHYNPGFVQPTYNSFVGWTADTYIDAYNKSAHSLVYTTAFTGLYKSTASRLAVDTVMCTTSNFSCARPSVYLASTMEYASPARMNETVSIMFVRPVRAHRVNPCHHPELLFHSRSCMSGVVRTPPDMLYKTKLATIKTAQSTLARYFISPAMMGTPATPVSTCRPPITFSHDGKCVPCTVCTRVQFQQTAPTMHSDRVCKPKTICSRGQYKTSLGTPTSDATCSTLTTRSSRVYYIAVGPTPTTDRVWTHRTTACPHGTYYTRQVNAGWNQVSLTPACTPCPAGTTTHVSGVSTTTHTMPACVAITHPVCEQRWFDQAAFDASNGVLTPNAFCKRCKTCLIEVGVATECNETHDTQCNTTPTTTTDTSTRRVCSRNHFLNSYNNINVCTPCTECKIDGFSAYKHYCTATTDAECSPSKIVLYIKIVLLMVLGSQPIIVAWSMFLYIKKHTS